MSTNKSDEIDLGALLGGINKFFKGILVSIYNVINFGFRNWLIILILILIGAALGYFTKDEGNLPKNAQVVIRTNYDSADYAYNALELLLYKSKEKDTVFLERNGFDKDTIEIKKLEIEPIVSFNDIATKYEPNDRNLDALLRNLDFEEKSDKITTFNSDYKYHTIEFSLSSAADDSTIDKVMNYLNNQELIKEMSSVGKQSILDNIGRNNKTFAQIDTILDNYSKGQPLPSPNSQIFVVDKNFNLSQMLELKLELQKENRKLKEELVFAENAIVKLSDDSVFTENPGILGNNMILYPIFLVFLFLIISWIRHAYSYLKRLAQE